MEDLAAHNWDFKTPLLMDFNKSNVERLDDGADKFFDTISDGQKCAQYATKDEDFSNNSRLTFDIGPDRVPTVPAKVNEQEQATSTSSNVMDITDDKENVPEVVKDEVFEPEMVKPQENAHSNIMTPSRLATWNKPTINKKNLKVKAPPTKAAPALRRSVSALTKARELRARRSTPPTSGEPAIKKSRSNNSTPVLKHKRANSANFAIPNVLKRQPHTSTQHHRGLTSEQREMKEIKELKEKLKREKQIAAESLKKINSAKPSVVVHAKKTEVKEFHFETDKRSKIHPMKTRCDESESMKVDDFTKGLRSHSNTPNKTPHLTKIQPFELSKGKKRKLEGKSQESPPFNPVPMAKMILNFHKATPSRFHTRNKNAKPAPLGPMKVPRITEPHTPKLVSTSRHRPISVISAAEQEAKELEEIKQNKFKAKPIDPNIFTGPETLKKVEKKPQTVPVEFKLSKPKKVVVEPAPVPAFKANPCPTFDKITGVKEKVIIAPTAPESPAFALKNRLKPKVLKPETFKMKHNYRPAPVGSGIKSKMVIKKAPPIKAIPFSFDVRDKEKLALKEQKIKELKENELKVKPFKANMMPIPDSPSQSLPVKTKIKLTKPIAPQFHTDERAALRVTETNASIDKTDSELRKGTLFKATLMPDPEAKWEPKRTRKTTTEPLDVQLASEKRAQLRKEIEKEKLKEEAAMRAVQQEIEKEKAEQEKIEIKKLRRKMVPKANPIPVVEEFLVKASTKQPTIPESPKFSDRFTK